MRQLHQKQMATLAAILLSALLFQNFDFAEGWSWDFGPLKEEMRQAHARELLGKHYDGSYAQQVEHSPALSLAIYNEVYRSLPSKYKNRSAEVARSILKDSSFYEIDPVFVMAVIHTESSFNPLARGPVGEIGLMQLRPTTAEWIAKMYGLSYQGNKTLENPVENVKFGIAYFHWLRTKFDGYANKYLSAYNMGAAKVAQLYAQEKKPKDYSQKVMKHYRATYARLAVATNASLIADNR